MYEMKQRSKKQITLNPYQPLYQRDQQISMQVHEDIFTPSVRISFEIQKNDPKHYVNPYYCITLTKINNQPYFQDQYAIYQSYLRNKNESYDELTQIYMREEDAYNDEGNDVSNYFKKQQRIHKKQFQINQIVSLPLSTFVFEQVLKKGTELEFRVNQNAVYGQNLMQMSEYTPVADRQVYINDPTYISTDLAFKIADLNIDVQQFPQEILQEINNYISPKIYSKQCLQDSQPEQTMFQFTPQSENLCVFFKPYMNQERKIVTSLIEQQLSQFFSIQNINLAVITRLDKYICFPLPRIKEFSIQQSGKELFNTNKYKQDQLSSRNNGFTYLNGKVNTMNYVMNFSVVPKEVGMINLHFLPLDANESILWELYCISY